MVEMFYFFIVLSPLLWFFQFLFIGE